MEEGDPDWKGGHPQLAQVAIQQGRLLAKNLQRLEKGKDLKPFRYLNLGTMATVGRNRAVAEFKNIKMAGFVAWIMWLVVHLRSILGVRNKIIVFFNWMWSYFSYSQSLRLIVYARKAKEVRDRELRLADSHWGQDLMSEGADEIKLEGEQ
jgi:NADH dehydrogenase